jgi:dihydrofolate reductase
MKIALIAALANDGTIGHEGKIPWHISADLKRFKQSTMGHAIIMGRKTFESIGRPLPGRKNLILTRNRAFQAPEGAWTFPSLDDALKFCREQKESIVFIIGGAEVYREALAIADTLLLTHVHSDVTGDTKFPQLNHSEWIETARQNLPECTFVEYKRRRDD